VALVALAFDPAQHDGAGCQLLRRRAERACRGFWHT